MRQRWLLLTMVGLFIAPVPAQVWLDAPNQVVPSSSVPIRLSWGRHRQPVTLSVYRTEKVVVRNGKPVLQKDLRDLVFQKQVMPERRRYWTMVPVPLLETGVYVAEVQDGKEKERQTIVVTRLLLVTKKSPQRLLAFTADAASGKPISNCLVIVSDLKGKRLAEATTNQQGLALLNLSEEDVLVEALAPDGSLARLDARSAFYQRYTVYLYTDRPIYRPNQRVHFKGIVREWRGDDYYPVTDKPVQVLVRDPEDREIARFKLTTNRFGSFAGTVELPERAPLGYYGIVATIDEEEHFCDFLVEEYRKPEFQVTLKADKPYYVLGDIAIVRIKVTYFFGAPVANGQATYMVSVSPLWWSPFDEEDEVAPYYYSGEFVLRRTIRLDERGEAEVVIPTDILLKRRPYDALMTVRCMVTDQSNRTFSAVTTARLYRAAFRIAVTKDKFLYRRGETAVVRIKTEDLEGKPVSVSLWVALEHERWSAKTHRWERIVVEKRSVTTDQGGEATVNFALLREGYFRIACWGQDEKGRMTSDATWLWIAERGDFDYNYPSLEVLTDKRRYLIGETAQVLVNANRKNVWVLVTVEGRELMNAFVMPLPHQSATFSLPITAQMRPGCWLCVGYVWDGNFISASRSLLVPCPEKFLQVHIATDKTTYQPRETVRYQISIRDAEGNPVRTEFSLGVVDEAIYALMPDMTPDIRRFFYSLPENRVATDWRWVETTPARFAAAFREKARQGLVTAGAFQKVKEEEVRRRFEDTAFWAPFVETDERGEAVVEVPLPDNLTTWRATVRAISLTTQVGSAIQKIRATKPLLVRLQLPRFLTQRDVVKALTVVHNNTDEPQTVYVGLKAKGAQVSLPRPVSSAESSLQLVRADGAPEQKAEIAPHSAHTFAWWVTVPEVPANGKAVFTAAVASESGLTDAVELSVPVKPRGVEVIHAKAGITEEVATVTLQVPPDAIVPGSYIEVRLSPSLLGPILGSLEYLVGYPYG